MKVLNSPESPRQRNMRRVSKPVMEKRRRERINHSLETLRLLMLENTHNEKLKNPKVEKAEILESVVHFLQTEKDAGKDERPVKQRPSCASQHNYQEGMTSCLLRISHFIASKNQELEEGGGHSPLPEPQVRPSSPGHIHHSRPVIPTGAGDSPHPYLHCDTRKLLSSTNISDPVWRPWPQ